MQRIRALKGLDKLSYRDLKIWCQHCIFDRIVQTATLVLGCIYQINRDYLEGTQPSIPTGHQQLIAQRSSAAPSWRNVTQPTRQKNKFSEKLLFLISKGTQEYSAVSVIYCFQKEYWDFTLSPHMQTMGDTTDISYTLMRSTLRTEKKNPNPQSKPCYPDTLSLMICVQVECRSTFQALYQLLIRKKFRFRELQACFKKIPPWNGNLKDTLKSFWKDTKFHTERIRIASSDQTELKHIHIYCHLKLLSYSFQD